MSVGSLFVLGSERALRGRGETFVGSPEIPLDFTRTGPSKSASECALDQQQMVHIKVGVRRAWGERLGVHSGHGEPGRIDC